VTEIEIQIADLLASAKSGNRVALARLLSLVERGGEGARALAKATYLCALPYTVGITGAPGAGKSTLTNALVGVIRKGWPKSNEPGALTEAIEPVGVLAIDPSSPFSGGAILGDRVRMQDHATDASIFIRSMATRGALGGLAVAVPEALRVFGAVTMPVVIVETVGVGQMEVEVASATDTVVVVVNPGWGDSMQANKAGLLEIADLFVINKADRPGAREARRDLDQMLDLSTLGEWRPPIIETVAATGEGVDNLWATISAHRDFLLHEGRLVERRRLRLAQEFRRVVTAALQASVEEMIRSDRYREVLGALEAGTLDPYSAADALFNN
jgi:LAO/AO transport system kinase